MESGVILIIITMFAVFGAYYLSDLAAQWFAGRKHLRRAVVVISGESPEEIWENVMVVRGRMPELSVLAVYEQKQSACLREPGMKNIRVVAAEELTPALEEALHSV